MAVKVGCSGFPVSHERYYDALRFVEVDATFFQPPRAATLERWREQAPKDFEFAVRAWQVITHPATSPTYRRMSTAIKPARLAACGHFQDTPEVAEAWQRTAEAARALRARVVVFQTPATFYPGADNLRALYRFFKALPRGEFACVFEPKGESWTHDLVSRVCKELGLVHALDPFQTAPPKEGVRYFRLQGGWRDRHVQVDHRYSDQEMARVSALCDGHRGFVVFGNADRFDDACRFQEKNA